MNGIERPVLLAVVIVIIGASIGVFAALGSPGWGLALLVAAEVVLAIAMGWALRPKAPR